MRHHDIRIDSLSATFDGVYYLKIAPPVWTAARERITDVISDQMNDIFELRLVYDMNDVYEREQLR